jgi:diguanylate cyclase (GGDEF)-like protein
MKGFGSITSERFRTAFMSFYVLSSLLPILVMMYVIIQYVRPHLSPSQIDDLMTPVTYGLVAMFIIPALGLLLMTVWIRSLEHLTADVKAKAGEVLSERVEITEKNEIFSLQRHVDGMYGELQSKIKQLNDASKELMEQKKKISQMTVTDELTGLFNRRRFERALMDQIQQAEKGKHSLALIMLDVDGFRKYNRVFGHGEGDQLLRELGLLVKDYLKKSGLPFRYGGDEFAVILPRKDIESAAAVAHEMVGAARRIAVKSDPKAGPAELRINCGVVSYDGAFNGLFLEADRCLTEANAAGKGSVVLLTPKHLSGA